MSRYRSRRSYKVNLFWPFVSVLLVLAIYLFLFVPEPASAQITGVDDIIDFANQAAKNATASLSNTWVEVIQSPSYAQVNRWGAGFAAIGTIIWAFHHRGLFKGEMAAKDVATDIMQGPIIVMVILLFNTTGYPFLGTLSLQFRESATVAATGFSNAFSSSLQDPLSSAIAKKSTAKLFADRITKCTKEARDDERDKCLDDAQTATIQELQKWVAAGEPWAVDMRNTVIDTVSASKNKNIFEAAGSVITNLWQKLGYGAGNIDQLASTATIVALGVAARYAVDVVMLLFVSVGPLLVGLSVIPIFSNFWEMWLKSLFGAAGINMFFNIASTIVAISATANAAEWIDSSSITLSWIYIALSGSFCAAIGAAWFQAGQRAVGETVSTFKSAIGGVFENE